MSQKLSIPSHVMARQVGTEIVLLNLNNEQYYGLDEVGTRIWQVITTMDSLDAGLETLQAEYDVEAEALRQDIASLVNELLEQGLLEQHDS